MSKTKTAEDYKKDRDIHIAVLTLLRAQIEHIEEEYSLPPRS